MSIMIIYYMKTHIEICSFFCRFSFVGTFVISIFHTAINANETICNNNSKSRYRHGTHFIPLFRHMFFFFSCRWLFFVLLDGCLNANDSSMNYLWKFCIIDIVVPAHMCAHLHVSLLRNIMNIRYWYDSQ